MTGSATNHLDVLIVGAGISGIGAAHYLQDRSPTKSFAILEARASIGGTWDLFRYPGVRSDSDLYTFGYEFRPWRDERSIASGQRILDYLAATAREERIDQRIRLHHRVVAAEWSSDADLWTVQVERTDTGEHLVLTCDWLFCAGGYYRYDRGYDARLPGIDHFRGQVVHPQFWPDDLDVTGKRVVVVGSGATAVTIVPAVAEAAASVTMVQRTPSYILPTGSRDRIALALRRLLGDERAHPMIRRKNIAVQRALWLFCQRFPTRARRFIRWANTKALPPGYPVDTHFAPPYDPWDQRLCFVPDGDFFQSIREGKAEVVTDRIRTFTDTGLQLESGRTLEADLVVTATGLEVQAFAGIRLVVDGDPVVLRDHLAYRGMMLDGVPNFAYAIGYTNASWTLKIGLLCEYFTRLLNRMDQHGDAVCMPVRPVEDGTTRPLLDFAAGYVQRAVDRLPRQGSESPWLTSMNYHDDVRLLRRAPVADRFLRFRPRRRGAVAERRVTGGRVTA